MNVTMFMRPFSLIFMMIWFGLLIFAESRVIDQNIARSYIPVGMIVFGLVLSLGGFYFEALKVMPLLSEALFNPAISTAAVPATDSRMATPFDSPKAERSRARSAGMAVAGLVLIGAFLPFGLYQYVLKSSPAFTAAVELAGSTKAKIALGEGVRVGAWTRGVLHQGGASGYAILAIPLKGSAGAGTLYTVANRSVGEWHIERAVLHLSSGSNRSQTIDLTPPVEPAHFDYPASGKVYLVPLDTGAASDLAELPAYYKAKLNLDVILLGTQQLETYATDPKSGQVIAERAFDAIERAHPEIAQDLESVILGVTSRDLNIQSSGWRFTTNYRRGRFGILSTARLHGLPWFAGTNPEVYATRVRKMVTKNLALLYYPLELSPDRSSVLATSVFTAGQVDEMGEAFDRAPLVGFDPLCVTIMQGPGGKQSWRVSCGHNDAPDDSRFETFETYPGIPLFVLSRTDFPLDGSREFSFVREYRPQDDRSRAFGIGSTDSFDIYPVGDSQTFSSIELILAGGEKIHYERTSPGSSYSDARLRAGSYMGSPFSLSSLAWNGLGWTMETRDGWAFQFPACGPSSTWQDCALVGLRSASGQAYEIQRTGARDLREIRTPNGTTITFNVDAQHRITSARETSGRTVDYEYDSAGRLVHTRDSQNGDEYYEYDPANRMTAVLNPQHQPLLINKYGYLGEIQSQTLADGGKLLYESGFNESHKLDYLKLTLPNGYQIESFLTREGWTRSWPRAPSNP